MADGLTGQELITIITDICRVISLNSAERIEGYVLHVCPIQSWSHMSLPLLVCHDSLSQRIVSERMEEILGVPVS